MKAVRAKKKLGQHFLKDSCIAEKIAETLRFDTYEKVLRNRSRNGSTYSVFSKKGMSI